MRRKEELGRSAPFHYICICTDGERLGSLKRKQEKNNSEIGWNDKKQAEKNDMQDPREGKKGAGICFIQEIRHFFHCNVRGRGRGGGCQWWRLQCNKREDQDNEDMFTFCEKWKGKSSAKNKGLSRNWGPRKNKKNLKNLHNVSSQRSE